MLALQSNIILMLTLKMWDFIFAHNIVFSQHNYVIKYLFRKGF